MHVLTVGDTMHTQGLATAAQRNMSSLFGQSYDFDVTHSQMNANIRLNHRCDSSSFQKHMQA